MQEIGLPDLDPEPLREMDSVEHLEQLSRVGQAAASRQVNVDHFGSFVPKH
jgi:hypothetical protein